MTNYVLWLVSWYPGKTDIFNGDFIERHANAVSGFTPVVVIFITKDPSLKKGQAVIEKKVEGNLTVYRGYYPTSSFSFSEKLVSLFKYFLLQKKIFSQIKKEREMPGLVHVHVAFKAGLFARYLKKIYQIPYIITEHWTGYYPGSPNSIYKADFFTIRFTKWILKGASFLLPVANKLGETINKFVPVKRIVVPNVVNTDLFYYKPVNNGKFRFIHPSTMSYVKNPEGILRAAVELNKQGYSFELWMIGGVSEPLLEMAEKSGGLNRYIFFKKEIPYAQVASEMQHASALVLFSRFENLPCVILEALCCGLPVVSTNVGGISEVLDQNNGILVQSENEVELKNALKEMIENVHLFKRENIAREAAVKFAYTTIGRQISDVYALVLRQ